MKKKYFYSAVDQASHIYFFALSLFAIYISKIDKRLLSAVLSLVGFILISSFAYTFMVFCLSLDKIQIYRMEGNYWEANKFIIQNFTMLVFYLFSGLFLFNLKAEINK